MTSSAEHDRTAAAMRYSGVLVVLAASLAGTFAGAQTTGKPVGVGTAAISGRVIDRHSERPLEEVMVTVLFVDRDFGSEAVLPANAQMAGLRGPDRRHDAKTMTTRDGRYSLRELPAGRYAVVASRPGYALQMHGFSDFNPVGAKLVEARAGQHVGDVNFALERGATVRGQVFDQNGAPFEDADVRVSPISVGSRIGLLPITASANARGEYRLEDLPPGTYRFAATVIRKPPAGGSPIQLPLNSQTVYFPGVTTGSDAGILTLAPGDAVNDVNIMIPASELFTIDGTVLRSSSTDRIDLFCTSSPASSVRRVVVTEDGRFTISGVKRGRYALSAKAKTQDGFEAAWQSIDIVDNMHDLQLAMMPAGQIGGRVVTDTGGPLPIDGIRVVAALTDGDHDIDPLSRDQVEIAADGTFILDGLFGERTLRVIGLPSGWTLGRVQVGKQRSARITIGPGDRIDDLLLVITRQ